MGLFDTATAAARASGAVDLRIAQAVEIVEAYGATLEGSKRAPGTIADAAELPYPKDLIKWALLILLAAIRDAWQREPLKAGYVALAEWQTHADFQAATFDSSRLKRKIDPLALAKELASTRTPEDRWTQAARAEQSALIAELRAKGFW